MIGKYLNFFNNRKQSKIVTTQPYKISKVYSGSGVPRLTTDRSDGTVLITIAEKH